MRIFKSFSAVKLIGILAFGLSVSTTSTAAVLEFDGGGMLTDATGVTVGVSVFNVTFYHGSCESVFQFAPPGCFVDADFDFHTRTDAELAANALLDQVFIGALDTSPELICGPGALSANACAAIIPIAPFGSNLIAYAAAINLDTVFDLVTFQNTALERDKELVIGDQRIFARFSISGVPIPASAWLFGTALLGLLGSKRLSH